MPLPLIPIITALTAGGNLVPHAAGGLIVTSAGGYVAGTYLSSAAVYAVVAGALGAGALTVASVASAFIGSAGYFGTTVGATGLTGVLMSAGILPATPILVPIVAGLSLGAGGVGLAYLAYLVVKLKKKLRAAQRGEEVQFTEAEAKIIEALIRRFAMRGAQGSDNPT